MAGSPKKRARRLGIEIPTKVPGTPGGPPARAPARPVWVPTDSELLERARITLWCAMNPEAPVRDAVTAARVSFEATRKSEVELLIEQLGTEEAALAWMNRVHPQLQEKAAAKAAKAQATGETVDPDAPVSVHS